MFNFTETVAPVDVSPPIADPAAAIANFTNADGKIDVAKFNEWLQKHNQTITQQHSGKVEVTAEEAAKTNTSEFNLCIIITHLSLILTLNLFH